MTFTDIFIKRPVLATVISALIIVLGLRAMLSMPIRQYPETENAIVTVTTAYFGADPDVVAGFITAPLEAAIAEANGIDYINSTSANSLSTITVNLRLNYDYNRALTEITAKISSVIGRLPPESQQPSVAVQVGQAFSTRFIAFRSDVLEPNQITDYLSRVVQPKLQTVRGVQKANIFGARQFALRAWLDPGKLAAYKLTAADITRALGQNDFISSIGNTKGQMVQVNLNASTALHSVDEFRNLVVRQSGGAIVRLSDVATVVLGAEDYETSIAANGIPAMVIAVDIAPDANLLEVNGAIQKLFPSIEAQLPEGVEGWIVYDAAKFVGMAITEVEHTIIEALLIVMLVVFAFLGSLRSVIIPIVAIPLSLIGAFMLMLALGFSINLLSLLAMVLAIGLVVDDAIIVVENVDRHINEEGATPFDAAITAARELAVPILAMLAVLVAVYIPIAFQGGLTGALFIEFAFTLVGTILVSTIVALTLSPMMASRLLKPRHELPQGWQTRFSGFIDRKFDRLQHYYDERLKRSLNFVPVTVTFAVVVMLGTGVLWTMTRQELAPQEDAGFIMGFGGTSPTATSDQNRIYTEAVYDRIKDQEGVDAIFQVTGPGQLFMGAVLKPWGERSRSATTIQQALQGELAQVAGLNLFVAQPPPLPSSFGAPFQVVIGTTEPHTRLAEVTQNFMAELRKETTFYYMDADLKIDRPQATLEIDRDKAALLGVTMADIGSGLSAMLGGGFVNYFSMEGRSYRVMAQADRPFRLNADQILDYYIRTGSGELVPVSTVAKIEMKTTPQSLARFQQMNAATVNGVPGVAQGDAIAAAQRTAARVLPEGYTLDFAGTSRQYIQESSGFLTLILFAAVLVYLVLAALYESFRDPVIILMSVPMSIAGAMVFVYLGGALQVFFPGVMQFGGATKNIYTMVGMVTLIGLISKHGILIVDVANRLQREGKSKHEAIVGAVHVRLRPILMTSAAMVLGVVPLLLAGGAGAVARFSMGLVIFSGISIGTLFTLFVVPAFYMLIAEDHSRSRTRTGETLTA